MGMRTVGFANWGSQHGFMEADLRLSIMDYRRAKTSDNRAPFKP